MESINFENTTKEFKKNDLGHSREDVKKAIEEQSSGQEHSIYLDNINIDELGEEEIEIYKIFKEESASDEDLKLKLISLQNKELKEMKEHPENHQWTSREYFVEFLLNRLNVRHLRRQLEEEQK